MIRVRGIALVAVALGVFVLAGVTGVGWLLLLDAMLWGTIVVSAVAPWLATGDLEARRRLIPASLEGRPGPMVGEPISFEIALTNRGLLPAMFVSVDYNLGASLAEANHNRLFIAWLNRRAQLDVRPTVCYSRRGVRVLSPVRLEAGLLFGLFRRSRKLGGSSRVLVLPKVYRVGRLGAGGVLGSSSGRRFVARTGPYSVGSRRYLPMDPWRHIHWRNTARAGDLQVKVFEESVDLYLTIALDTGMAVGEGAFECAVTVAASVGDHICRCGGTVRLVAGDIDEETHDANHLLSTLALVEPNAEDSTGEHVTGGLWSGDILVITSAKGSASVRALVANSRPDRQLTAVLLMSGEVPEERRTVHSQRRIRVVECWPDNPRAALEALEALGGRPVPRPVNGLSG